MYAYVGGDPVNYTDPTGLKDEVISTGTRRICQGTCITDPFDIQRFMRENSTLLGSLTGAMESMMAGIGTAVGDFVEEQQCRLDNLAVKAARGLRNLQALTGNEHGYLFGLKPGERNLGFITNSFTSGLSSRINDREIHAALGSFKVLYLVQSIIILLKFIAF